MPDFRSHGPSEFRVRSPVFLASLLIALVRVRLAAQTPPSLGSEFQINTYTSASETGPAVSCNPDGTFIVTWTDNSEDGSDFGVFGQRFDGAGLKAGDEFRVNSYTTGYQWFPSVGSDEQGNFVVVWYGVGAGSTSATDYSIFGKRYNAAGAPVGTDFVANTFTGGDVFGGDVAVAPAGDFVVVWTAKDEVSDYDVFGQRFSSAGTKVGSEFLVNTYTTGRQINGRVALDRSGGFVVVWTSVDQDGSDSGVFGQRFNSSGAKAGSEFQVNTYTTGYQGAARVAADRGGNFVVVWSEEAGGGPSRNILGQRFDGSGEKVGTEFQVNTTTGANYSSPGLTMDPSGNFLVVWTGSDGDGNGVLGQRFDRAGNRIGTTFAVNAYTTDNQSRANVCDAGHGFVVTWDSHEQNDAGYGVFGRRQRFHPDGLAVDVHGNGTSDLNGVLEPGEAAVVEPHWTNEGGGVHGLTGNTASVTGPAGPTYTLLDGTAAYGDILFGVQTDCNATADCYAVQISGTRPSTHWDAEFQEDLDIGGSTDLEDSPGRQLHGRAALRTVLQEDRNAATQRHHGRLQCDAVLSLGLRHARRDVHLHRQGHRRAGRPRANGRRRGRFRVRLRLRGPFPLHRRVPDRLLLQARSLPGRAKRHAGMHADTVLPEPDDHPGRDGFLHRKGDRGAKGGTAVPVSYTDPVTSRSYSCISGSANLHFTDVPVSNAFCKHIHYLWAKGIVDGCTATKYCPSSPVARDAMAKFIANGLGLQLYGP